MSDTKMLISQLDQKVELLLSRIGEQQSVLDAKRQEVDDLKRKLAENESVVLQLKTENQALRDAQAEPKKDSEEMKVRISELVGEIDKCISLLKV